ncbi:MAG: efflux RND transporter periplasmic adaptor subunit [Alphaproteobacteria bacterium]
MKTSPRHLAVIIAAAFLGLSACDDADDKAGGAPKAEPPTVSVAGVTSKEVVRTSEFIGSVEAVDDVDLIARVEGFLQETLVEDGASIAAGDVLFRIEPENFAAAKARAVADLEQSRANLALAELDIERDTKLLASGTIAQSRYDATKAARDAQAAIVEAKRADLRQAELNLTYTEIAAPFDGRIGKTRFSVGDVVGPAGGPLASLVRVSPVYVGFSLSEGEFISAVERLGGDVSKALNPENSPPVRLRLPNGEVFDETGWLVFVDNKVDPATGTIALRAQFDNAGGFLVPGIFVNVEIDSKKAATKLLVPQAAVQRDQKGDFVLVVGADGLVEQRHIVTGRQVETDFVVEEGLQEGESVIVEGLQRVRPGVPVKAVGATGQGG